MIYIKKISYEDIVNKFKDKNIEFREEKALERLKEGGNYSIPVINKLNEIKNVYTSNKITDFEGFGNSIKRYRNLIIHSWPSFQIHNKVPKKDYVRTYQDYEKISNITNLDELNKIINDHFIDMQELLAKEVTALTAILNEIWDDVVNDLREFNKQHARQEVAMK